SLGIRSTNIAFPAGRPLSVSQDAPLDTAEPTTSFPPSQIFLSPLKKRVQVPLAVEVKRSPSSRRHIHRKAQLMVPGSMYLDGKITFFSKHPYRRHRKNRTLLLSL
ncbi:hypothetical protein WA588_001275, partial [Blastocystis sp. NMH]